MSGTAPKLVVVLCCALALRAAAAVAVQSYLDRSGRSFLIEGDAEGYWLLGLRLAHGQPYAVYSPPRRVLRMPGFPLLLAASVRLFGENLLAARLVLAAVGTAACFVVYLLGRELFDGRVAVAAAGWAAVAPHFVGFSVVLLSETLFALLLVLSLWAAARLVRALGWRWEGGLDGPSEPLDAPPASARPADTVCGGSSSVRPPDRPGPTRSTSSPQAARRALVWAGVCGLLCAAACYARPSWLLAAPALAVLLLVRRPDRQTLLCGSLLVLGLLAGLLPWVVRNYRVTGGRLVLTTLWLGPSLYDGLNPNATGDSNLDFFDRDLLLTRMSEYDMNRYYVRKAVRFAVEHPGRVLQLALAKLVRFWKPWPNAEQFRRWWLSGPLAVFFVLLVVFSVYGGWVSRHRPWAWVLTAGPLLYFCLLHTVFVASLRYRLPGEYPLCVLAAAGWVAWWQRRRQRRAPAACSQPLDPDQPLDETTRPS